MSEISKLPSSVNIPSTTSELSGSTPHNIEAEQALLGALMINNDVFDRIDNIVNETHFFDPVHQKIFEVAAVRIKNNSLARELFFIRTAATSKIF